tara:strand:+ start:5100 stop:5378 length:279 start_codon:yes stop_codon:yes gene_type:complete
MYIQELKKLVDNIQCDSMSRDEVFYDSGQGTLERRKEFFNLINELQGYFDYYLQNEEHLMNKATEDEFSDCEFSGLVKSLNNNIRSKSIEVT